MTRCRDCRWWDRGRIERDDDFREESRPWTPRDHAPCRSGGPRWVMGHKGQWPRTWDNDWCRGFEPRTAEQKVSDLAREDYEALKRAIRWIEKRLGDGSAQ